MINFVDVLYIVVPAFVEEAVEVKHLRSDFSKQS